MYGDGGFLDRDIASQIDMLQDLSYDYKNLEFYTRGGKANEQKTTESTSSLLGKAQEEKAPQEA